MEDGTMVCFRLEDWEIVGVLERGGWSQKRVIRGSKPTLILRVDPPHFFSFRHHLRPQDTSAVKSFQQGSNLTGDRVVGPMTWKALPADPQHRCASCAR